MLLKRAKTPTRSGLNAEASFEVGRKRRRVLAIWRGLCLEADLRRDRVARVVCFLFLGHHRCEGQGRIMKSKNFMYSDSWSYDHFILTCEGVIGRAVVGV
jgi:hypothetical protein